jgi:uncharacterized protein YigA (DUF484 family)
MTITTEDAKALTGTVLTDEAVAEHLKRNPNFLNEHPDVLLALVPPEMDRGRGVVDMQRFMLERLRVELATRKGREGKLLQAARSNADVQAKVHLAVRALLQAPSLEELIRIIVGKLPKMFDIAAAALCVESDKTLPGVGKTGIVLVPNGTLDELLAEERPVALRAGVAGDERIFGPKAGQINSVALMRLELGRKAPKALLVLGARSPAGFDPRDGTELLGFFAYVLQHSIRRWLGNAP